MKMWYWIAPALLLGGLALAGCDEGVPPAPKPSAEKSDKDTGLAQLAPEDRRLAEAQKVCPVRGRRWARWGRRSR